MSTNREGCVCDCVDGGKEKRMGEGGGEGCA